MSPYPRLAFRNWPAAVYAIGDIHGCIDQFVSLEEQIAEDGLGIEGEKWIVTLGDHVDRGPDSAAVIERLLGPAPSGFRRFSLVGNHEEMLMNYLDAPDAVAAYLGEGGRETLASYGRGNGELDGDPGALLPERHRAFIASLPSCLALPGWLFVHAGIRPGLPLALQDDHDLLWIRAPFLTSQLTGGQRVVHGQRPGATSSSRPIASVSTHTASPPGVSPPCESRRTEEPRSSQPMVPHPPGPVGAKGRRPCATRR
jgi:serine/threonine protein phosphatase 1